MAIDFIKPDELLKTFNDAKKFMLPLHEPFEEFERIARNRPHPGIGKHLPKVTDGTLASIIQEKPKRIIQQIPTATIEAADEWLEIVSQYILHNEIIPNANEEAAFLQKCWAAVSKAMIYGSQPAFVRFINRGDYFGTDFTLPYIKDVLLEPGKVSDRASNIIFLRTWWTKSQIQAVIDKENMLGKRAKDRGEEYETGWNLAQLNKLMDEGTSQKDANAQQPIEKGKMLNAGFYEIVHCFQRGIGGKFYSFSPKLPDGDNLLRTRTNPDPRGVIPIHFLYNDQDLANPLGRGAVEMSGGVQNLLDSEMQMYQWNRALMLNPPLKKKGNFSKSQIKFVPNHVMDLGSDPDADVEAFTIDNTAIQNFANNHGLLKSQILNLNSTLDTSVSSESGNPGFSKTDAGVKSNSERLGISDNYTRKQFESWVGDIFETGINLYFAERHGVQVLTLDGETASKLRKLAPNSVNSQNQVRINYDTETPRLKLQIDASSSDMEDKQTQLEAAQGLLDQVKEDPTLDSRNGGPIDVTEVADRLVMASGIEDPEKIVVKPKDENGQPTQQQQPQLTPQMVQQMIAQAMEQEKANDPSEHPLIKAMAALNLKGTDLDADTLRAVIQQIFNIQSSAPLPMEVDQATKAHDMALKSDNQAHQQRMDMADALIKATTAKTNAMKASHDAHMKTAGTALEIAKAGESANQAAASHDLATQQAEQAAAAAEQQDNEPAGVA